MNSHDNVKQIKSEDGGDQMVLTEVISEKIEQSITDLQNVLDQASDGKSVQVLTKSQESNPKSHATSINNQEADQLVQDELKREELHRGDEATGSKPINIQISQADAGYMSPEQN